jgi:phage-related tail protein
MMYLRLAALAAFLAVAGLALWYRAEAATAAADAQQARANLAVAKSVISAQEEAMGRLRASAEQNAKDTAALVDELEAIHKAVADTNESVDNLRESNATVAEYLRSAVPDDLRLLLNGKGDGGG